MKTTQYTVLYSLH